MAIAVQGVDGNTFTTRDIDGSSSNFVTSIHKLVFSGSYATGGDTLDLSGVANLIPTGSLPIVVQLNAQGSGDCQTAEGGYYSIQKGTTLKNYLLQVWEAGGTELSAAAYDAEV